MRGIIFAVIICALSQFSCTTAVEESEVKVLEKEVLTIHDEAMEKLDVIHDTRFDLKKLKGTIDDTASLKEIDSAIFLLNSAQGGMMQWMNQYRVLEEGAEEEKAMSYLKYEKEKIIIVADKIDSSIENGKKTIHKFKK